MVSPHKIDANTLERLSHASWRRIMLGMAALAVFLATALVLWRVGLLDVLLAHFGDELPFNDLRRAGFS